MPYFDNELSGVINGTCWNIDLRPNEKNFYLFKSLLKKNKMKNKQNTRRLIKLNILKDNSNETQTLNMCEFNKVIS